MNHEPDRSRAGAVATLPGFILVDSNFSPIFMNPEAAAILRYADENKGARPNHKRLAEKIKGLFTGLGTDSKGCYSAKIQSGRRNYQCTLIALNPPSQGEQIVVSAIMLERNSRPLDFELTDRFSFTQRERQVFQLLALGLTTKEIAGRLDISPNTVKTFLRLVMAKTEVTTRSGILGKLLQNIKD
jgi:DNA-binding CsgD family transcriptional regulator